jgi:outer membrane lipoprotein-sorting protein
MREVRTLAAFAVLALLAGTTGCLFRTRVAEMHTSTAKLETATRQELIERINNEAAKIKTLNATVDIATSVGGEKKGKVTDYEEIRGYILVRKPDMLRMIGLFPIVRNKAFDMVSQGNQFELSIPAKNKFYVGHNDVIHPTANTLENLRPQVIYNALLMPEIDPQNNIAVLEDSTEIIYDAKNRKNLEQPDYVVDIVTRAGDQWYLSRKIIFDRTNLVPHQQVIYDQSGAIVTQATYQVYQDYNGVRFPNVVQINRPLEEYSIRLTVVKLAINDPLRDDQFALQQPAGSILVDMDQPQPSAANNATSPASSTSPAKP